MKGIIEDPNWRGRLSSGPVGAITVWRESQHQGNDPQLNVKSSVHIYSLTSTRLTEIFIFS